MSDIIIKLLSTDAVIALIIGAFVTYIVKWLAKDGEKFKQYEGYAITAIKAAESLIPDDTKNRGAAKLDFALRTFLSKYERATGTAPDAATAAKIESWITEIHTALDEAGAFNKVIEL
jgi:hypothetical protein